VARTTLDTSGRDGFKVTIDGLEAVRNGLESVDHKLRVKLDRELKTAIGVVAGASARKVDSRTGATAAGYKVSARDGRYRVQNKTVGAAMLESAAIPKVPQGATLIATLNEKYGKPDRILWASWVLTRPYVLDRITQIVDEARDELDAVMR